MGNTTHPPLTTALLPTASSIKKQEEFRKYLSDRTGTYEDRKRRYEQVAEILIDHGLDDTHQVLDFGAGQTEFDFYLRTELGWRGFMLNMDGALTGRDLNYAYPEAMNDFIVCIETIEHLDKPGEAIAKLEGGTSRVIVFTTPNPDKVDVLALCPGHKHAISVDDWKQMHYNVEVVDLYGHGGDTIIAWKDMTK